MTEAVEKKPVSFGKVATFFIIGAFVALFAIIFTTWLFSQFFGWFLAGIWLIGTILIAFMAVIIIMSWMDETYDLNMGRGW